MKLRMTEEGVRLRLRRSDVQLFAETGTVAAATKMPGGVRFTFRLTRATVEAPVVSLEGMVLEVRVPEAAGTNWALGEAVGIYGRQGEFEIVVEKDFRRTSLPSPDDEDRYPNPRANSGVKGS